MIKEKLAFWKVTSKALGRFFDKVLPFSPWHYTISSGVAAAIAIVFAYNHNYFTTIFLFFIAAFCDIIDGAVARHQNKSSHLGAYIDGVMDRFVDFAILFSFFFFNIKTPWMDLGAWISIASFVVILPSFNVAYANHRKAVKDDDETLIWRIMNRGEIFTLLLLTLITAVWNAYIAGYLLILLILLCSITIIQTIYTTIYHAKSNIH